MGWTTSALKREELEAFLGLQVLVMACTVKQACHIGCRPNGCPADLVQCRRPQVHFLGGLTSGGTFWPLG